MTTTQTTTDGPKPGEFCHAHFSWLCQAGQGECQKTTTSPTAPLDLDAIAARANAATPGPWRVVLDDTESATTVWQTCSSLDHPTGDDPDHIVVYDCCRDGALHGEPFHRAADAEFAAAARTDVPALVAEVRRLRERDAGEVADDDQLNDWCTDLRRGFEVFESREMAMWPDDRSRDRALIEWTVRCLANPDTPGSAPVLRRLMQRHQGGES